MKKLRQSIGAIVNVTGLLAVASQLTGFFH